MNFEQAFVCGLLITVLILFAWGRWRYDLVAAAAMIAVVAAGLVPAEQALQGFGHPAVVTVAAVLVISRALRLCGIVDLIASRLIPYTHSTAGHIAVLTGVVTIASAFMNNVGALALMLPVALATAARRNRSPSILLMPLAFGSLLGGLVTLIGTPPNIIIASFRAQSQAGEPFGMFAFTPVGLVIALGGVAFIALFGWRLIPEHRQGRRAPERLFAISDYITEVRAIEGSKLIGKKLAEIGALTNEEVVPVGLVRGKDSFIHPARWRIVRTGDLLILRADPAQLKALIDAYGLELVASKASALEGLKMEDLRLVEVTVTPGSPLEGRNTAYLRRRARGSLSLVALARQGEPIRSRLRHQNFRAGDVMLVQGDADTIDDVLTELGLLPLAERDLQIVQPRRAKIGLAIFVAALAAAASGLVPVAIAFMAAIGVYILTDILPLRDLYRDIDWPVIVLLGAMIPVGQALESTGTTALIAATIITLTAGLPPMQIMALLMILTIALSSVINNAATALVMAPIAMVIAEQLGVNSDAFLMAVAIGASSAFLTPIGHQSNTLVMGPGGYHFGDYWRLGLPLTILVVVIGIPMIALVWGL